MFIQPNFTFNNQYSKDLGISIITFGSDILNDIGVEYTSDVSIEHNLNEYNPCYTENPTEPNDIELNLAIYDPFTMIPIDVNDIDMEALYDWLVTDNFVPFISDDDIDLIYYFKVVKLQKVLSFRGNGYLRVTFRPYSKYAYRRRIYKLTITNSTSIEIFNLSRKIYYPMIEITNKGNVSTINKINNMNLTNINTNETIIIDNLSKLVQNTNGENKFNCCNRKWIKLEPRKENEIILSGNMEVKIICEFPVIL